MTTYQKFWEHGMDVLLEFLLHSLHQKHRDQGQSDEHCETDQQLDEVRAEGWRWGENPKWRWATFIDLPNHSWVKIITFVVLTRIKLAIVTVRFCLPYKGLSDEPHECDAVFFLLFWEWYVAHTHLWLVNTNQLCRYLKREKHIYCRHASLYLLCYLFILFI